MKKKSIKNPKYRKLWKNEENMDGEIVLKVRNNF